MIGVLCCFIVLLILSAGPASADPQAEPEGGMPVGVTVANASPAILEWKAVHEELLGLYRFEVVASDGNGVDDLSRVVVVFRDARGVETRHEEEAPDRENATAGSWQGLLRAEKKLIVTPVEISIEVHDRGGGIAVVEGQGEALIQWPWYDPEMKTAGQGAGNGSARADEALTEGARPKLEPTTRKDGGLDREVSIGHDLFREVPMPGVWLLGLMSMGLLVAACYRWR